MRKVVILVTVAILLVISATLAGCGGSDKAGGNSTTKGVSEAELGVPIYPGATKLAVSKGMPMQGSGTNGPPPQGGQPDSSAFQQSGNQPDTNGQNRMPGPRPGDMTMLWTRDSTSKVVAWYKEQLSGKTGFAEVTPPNPWGSGQSTTSVVYTFKSDNTTKAVMIRENNMDDKGGTSITIGDLPEGMPAGPPVNQSQQS